MAEKGTQNAGLNTLCFTLWLLGAGLLVYAAWLLADGASEAAVSGLVGIIMLAAGWGLYRRRRWGVALFGGLGVAGSIQYFVGTLLRFPELAASDPVMGAVAVFHVLAAFLIPAAMIYITIILWKHSGTK
jgi:hypothetical protein